MHQQAMDVCVKESKLMSTEKRSDNLQKASSILSVAAILLTIALFVRMETVVHDTKMMDSKFTLEIQQIKDALKEEKAFHEAGVKDHFDIVSGKLTFSCFHSLVFLGTLSMRELCLLLRAVYSRVRLSVIHIFRVFLSPAAVIKPRWG